MRQPVGLVRDRPQCDDELAGLVESGDTSPETMERIAELLGQFGPPGERRDER
jgi:hypothetical protein